MHHRRSLEYKPNNYAHKYINVDGLIAKIIIVVFVLFCFAWICPVSKCGQWDAKGYDGSARIGANNNLVYQDIIAAVGWQKQRWERELVKGCEIWTHHSAPHTIFGNAYLYNDGLYGYGYNDTWFILLLKRIFLISLSQL